MAPRPTTTALTPETIREPIVVAGALTAPTGLGEAARLTLMGLLAAGRDVRAIDLTRGLMQRSVVPLPSTPEPEPGPGTLLLFAQPPNVAHGLVLIGRKMLRHKRRVGCWVWDLEVLPKAWIASAPLLHEIAASSRFCQRTFARQLGRPVRLIGYPLAVAAPAELSGRTRSAVITFGAAFDLGSTAARKNPMAIARAFRRAFPKAEPVRLLIKLRDETADPAASAELRAMAAEQGPPIEIASGDFDRERLEGWWEHIDVLVSLHRSEGFGLVPAEAMLREIPVISTDWSATAEMVTAENGWPVPATLVPARDETGRYELPGALWAEPDLDAAVLAMRAAVRDRADIVSRGRRARADLLDAYSVERFAKQIGEPDLLGPEEVGPA